MRRRAARAQAVSQPDLFRATVAAPVFDPRGVAYCERNDASTRRGLGVTLTPRWLIDFMLGRTLEHGRYVRVVDAGCGTGRFAIAAAQAMPAAVVLGVELQSELASLARAAAAEADLASRVTILDADFCAVELPPVDGPTLFIGNPPYVRHHDLSADAKRRYQRELASLDLHGSQLAGLHAHFLAHIARLARPGDAVCLVLPAEWLDTGYGSAMRQLLAQRLGLVEMHLADPESAVFGDALVSSVVVLGVVGDGSATVRLGELGSAPAQACRNVPRERLLAAPRWSGLLGDDSAERGGIEVGEVFKVRRGQVTGSNTVWIHGAGYAGELPEAALRPCVTRARELLDLPEPELLSLSGLKRVIELPADWQERFDAESSGQIADFLDWAERQGARDGYIARHRQPWYGVRLGEPAPIVMTYMARRAPRFVLNTAGAGLLNIAHGLYPRQPMNSAELRRAVAALNLAADTSCGRAYAGKLVKFEPGDAMRMRFDWEI